MAANIILTNDYQANDTYALQNNDPESYLKTAAYLPRGSLSFQAGKPIVIEGTAMVGWSGLRGSSTGYDRALEGISNLPTATRPGSPPSGGTAN